MWVAEDLEWVCSRYLVFWIGVLYCRLLAKQMVSGKICLHYVPDMIGSTADVSYYTLSVCSMMAFTDVLIVYTFIRR